MRKVPPGIQTISSNGGLFASHCDCSAPLMVKLMLISSSAYTFSKLSAQAHLVHCYSGLQINTSCHFDPLLEYLALHLVGYRLPHGSFAIPNSGDVALIERINNGLPLF